MNILIFKHIKDEPAGHAEQWAEARGHSYSYHFWDKDNLLTRLPEFDFLIIMGGMMAAYDDDIYPWLAVEKKLIKETIDKDLKVLGICLGAQLIASALGARVYKNDFAEIGFHPVEITDNNKVLSGIEKQNCFFQWHGDTFDLPEGACRLATSVNVKNQAFSYRHNVFALQFHPEMDKNIIDGLLKNAYHAESYSPWKQSIDEIKSNIRFTDKAREQFFLFLDKISS